MTLSCYSYLKRLLNYLSFLGLPNFFLKFKLKLYYWVKLRDGPNETCPIQISRPFVCFELLWANVNTGKIVFDQSEFVLIWKLAENSKRTNDFWAIPQFDSLFQLYCENGVFRFLMPKLTKNLNISNENMDQNKLFGEKKFFKGSGMCAP